MPHLHAHIADQVSSWKQAGFPCDEFPVIADILEHQVIESEADLPRQSRYLRAAQIDALTTYWFLRLVRRTPAILELYQAAYPTKSDLRKALGLTSELLRDVIEDVGIDGLFAKVRDDAEFVARHKLESLRETLALDYPSYILALTMGAGKTALIGAIIATEFAMALEYPEGPFVQNALVFAPGLTIMRSLRQMASLPFDRILPPRLFKHFAATVKLIFTRDGDPDIPVTLGFPTDCVLAMTNESSAAEKAAFERLNEPESRHRVILLVNIGTEGWDCPSLFATALARELRSSNNFVLQAACRCLRQVPGNHHPASIYLTDDNRRTLDKELQETYNETLTDLNLATNRGLNATIKLRKVNIPPLVVKQTIRRVQRADTAPPDLHLTRPAHSGRGSLTRQSFDLHDASSRGEILTSRTPGVTTETAAETLDPYTTATKLAAVYRVDFWTIKNQLTNLYPDGEIPENHLSSLAAQVEAATSAYEMIEEQVEIALALVKPEGFDKTIAADGTETYTAEISYPVSHERLLLSWERFRESNAHDFGFHYDPYNFDSQPEADFFTTLLHQLNIAPEEVEDIYFTGALTSSAKSDFAIEYKDADGKWRSYTPDFILRRKDGRCLIIEIKDARHEAGIDEDLRRDKAGHPPVTHEGIKAIALKRWTRLNPERLKYELVFASNSLRPGATDEAVKFTT